MNRCTKDAVVQEESAGAEREIAIAAVTEFKSREQRRRKEKMFTDPPFTSNRMTYGGYQTFGEF